MTASGLLKQRLDQFTGSIFVDVYADSVAEVRPDAFDALIASESASLPSCTIDECFPFVLAQRRKRIGVSQDIKLGIGMNLFSGLYRCLFPTQLLIT